MSILTSLIAGLIFGIGLIVSGMANPSKILGFLDLAGMWDPSLVFVMVGAIAIAAGAFALAIRRGTSLLGLPMHLPTLTHIDWRLAAGSALFGVGWGIAGICPGPAIVLLGAGTAQGAIFVLAMLAGMLLFEFLQRRHLALKTVASPKDPGNNKQRSQHKRHRHK